MGAELTGTGGVLSTRFQPCSIMSDGLSGRARGDETVLWSPSFDVTVEPPLATFATKIAPALRLRYNSRCGK